MTENINGVEVIADEEVHSPLSRPDKPMIFKAVRRYLLADGRTVYKCQGCDFNDEKIGRVRNHHAVIHGGKKIGYAASKKARDAEAKRAKQVEPQLNGHVTAVDLEFTDEVHPPEVEDIFAALDALLVEKPASEEAQKRIDQLELEVHRLTRENKALTGERDWWKNQYDTSLATLQAIRSRLRDHGL